MTKETCKVWLQVCLMVGVVYLFLVSIGLMGSSFKLFGTGLARQLVHMTSNPVVGLFAGILATSLVQSSSTTTAIVVGLVAAGGLSVEGAVPIVMGANIGTSVTGTLVSLGHITRREEFRRARAGATVHDFFNVIAVLILFPFEMACGYLQRFSEVVAGGFAGVGGLRIGSPIKLVVGPVVHQLMDLLDNSAVLCLLLSLALLYLSLKLMVDLARGLVVSRAEQFLNRYLFGAPLPAMLFGLVLTALVQSSSITLSLVIPLVGAGILTVEQIFPYALGTNVGTTVTAMLAALSTGNVAAVTIAFVHLFFNVSGIALVYPLRAIRRIPVRLAVSVADFTSRSKIVSIVYIVLFFYVVPGLVILLWR
jgi:solute carrier family 34 (sodium-dependent phosphate cotransporter)